MFCTCCGKEIINTARFCNYCGNPVRNIAPPPAPVISQNMGQPMGQPGSVPFTPNIPTPETIMQPQPEAPQSVPVNAADEFAPTDAISDITSDIISDRIDVPTDTEAQPLESEPTVSEVTEQPITEPTISEPISSGFDTAAPEAAQEFSQTGMFTGAVPPFAPNGASDVYSAPIPPQYPTPGNIPKSGFSAPGYQPPLASAPQERPKRERKYTLGHIMLCLAAVAVMAITAGVFAGLYFSVV